MTNQMTMSPEAQRIAIATACGWTISQYANVGDDAGAWLISPDGEHVEHSYAADGLGDFIDSLPDFLNDLNACAEMENALKDEGQWNDYLDHLRKLCGADTGWEYTDCRNLLKSSAAQRAEAFLRTLNLWTSTPEAAK